MTIGEFLEKSDELNVKITEGFLNLDVWNFFAIIGVVIFVYVLVRNA
jgi:hypothetical protein